MANSGGLLKIQPHFFLQCNLEKCAINWSLQFGSWVIYMYKRFTKSTDRSRQLLQLTEQLLFRLLHSSKQFFLKPTVWISLYCMWTYRLPSPTSVAVRWLSKMVASYAQHWQHWHWHCYSWEASRSRQSQSWTAVYMAGDLGLVMRWDRK